MNEKVLETPEVPESTPPLIAKNTNEFTIENREEYLGPPKIRFMDVVLVFLGAIIAGFLSGLIVFVSSSLLIPNIGGAMKVSPILLELVAFFSLVIGSLVVYFITSLVLPHIYTRTMTALSHVTTYAVILYISLAPLYLIVDAYVMKNTAVFYVYSIHIILMVFGLNIVMGITSQYRYALLSVYSSIISLIITAMIVFMAFVSFGESGNMLFIFTGMMVIGFAIMILVNNLIGFLYYTLYSSTGYDPIGATFGRIENEEKEFEKKIESELTKF